MNGINKATIIVVSCILIFPCFASSKVVSTVKTEQNQTPILFVHGWYTKGTDWNIMREWFQANGWPETSLYAFTFDDRRDCSIQGNINNANRMKQWIDEILGETGAEKIDIVGHSMGGLSSRYYIKFLGGIDKVDDYVSVGTPHHGEEIGETCEICLKANALLLSLNEGDETPGGILNDTIGDRVAPYSGIIYNGTHIAGNISYTSIYSLTDGDVPTQSSLLHGANNIRIIGPDHSQLRWDWDVYKLVRTAVDDFNTTFLITPPTSFTAVPGDSQVNLWWKAPIDDGGAPIIEYKVYRAASSGGPFFLIVNTTALSYTDLDVTNEVIYYYVVTAVNSIGESEYSNEISTIPQIPITTTTTTTTTTPGWNIVFLLICLYGLSQLRPPKKNS